MKQTKKDFSANQITSINQQAVDTLLRKIEQPN